LKQSIILAQKGHNSFSQQTWTAR